MAPVDPDRVAELGARREALRAELRAVTAELAAAAQRAMEAGESQSAVARLARVDRMTVRKWAGEHP